MPDAMPVLLLPGLLCSPRLYQEQLSALWRFGPVTIADNTRADSMDEIARQILAAAPPCFALVGLSMGGYIAFEIMRQAPGRVSRLALLDTSARPDTPDRSEARRRQMALARAGRLDDVVDGLLPLLLHRAHRDDAGLRRTVHLMAQETGPEAFLRQQSAIIGRPDSRPALAAIHCPTVVAVGDDDALIPPENSEEIAAGIADARLVRIPGAGHLPTLERPTEVTRALASWLDE